MAEDKIAIDSNDYMELLIRHMARSKNVFDRARNLKVTGEDFVLDDTYGVQLYREFVDCIMSVGFAPIDFNLLVAHINRKIEDHIIPDAQFELAVELLDFIYAGDLSPLYFLETLREFVKGRRVKKLAYQHKDQPDQMIANMQSLMVDLRSDGVTEQAEDVHPFAAPVFATTQSLVGSGLRNLDSKIKGLALGEFAIIVGYSGGGKTVLGCNIVAGNAAAGVPSTFLSLEADKTEISQRMYSKFFEIPYGSLRDGNANIELEAVFRDPTLESKRELLARNLNLQGLKGMAPLNVDQIYDILLKKYETTGFAPQVVVLDQMQFIEPRYARKGADDWQKEKEVATELDELSHMSIGPHKFCLWVLHQAKGKLKGAFSREEIDGFKGIIHKPDLVLGIGRDSTEATDCWIFSLKVRHVAGFALKYNTDFKHMRFLDTSEVNDAMPSHRGNTSNPVDNTPPAPPPLPDLPEAVHA